MTPEIRFWRNVQKSVDPGGCWWWLAGVDGGGYGMILVDGRREKAHRLSWSLHFGPVPDGLWVLHRCDNPHCVNPAHLFVGTRSDNVRDAVAKGRHRGGEYWRNKTHCPQGHPYSAENTFLKRGSRQCRECSRARSARRYAATKGIL